MEIKVLSLINNAKKQGLVAHFSKDQTDWNPETMHPGKLTLVLQKLKPSENEAAKETVSATSKDVSADLP